jgi:hypothetical protein
MFSVVTGVSRKRCPLPVVVPRRRLHSDRKRESLVAKLFTYLLLPNLRTRTWGSDEINRVVHEAGRNIRDVLLEKARDLGIYRKAMEDIGSTMMFSTAYWMLLFTGFRMKPPATSASASLRLGEI